jgi:hypothetical protein
MALEPFEGGRSRAVTIPAGTKMQVVRFPWLDDARMAEMSWGDRFVAMFGQDLQSRALQISPKPIKERHGPAARASAKISSGPADEPRAPIVARAARAAGV